MEEGFRFPSQLWVLINEDDEPVNLVFVTSMGAWVREEGQWVEFVTDDENPKRQFEGMAVAPVDPRIIDFWDDKGGVIESSYLEPFEYKWSPPANEEDPETEAVTADAYGFVETAEDRLGAVLKRLLADNIWAAHHAQGYHWNVKGADFAQYHDLFQTIYDDYHLAIDPTAENLLKINESAPYTQSDLDAHRSIPDVPAADSPREMTVALLAINDGLRESTKIAFDEAAQADNQGLVDFLGARLDMLDKWSWQLRSSVA